MLINEVKLFQNREIESRHEIEVNLSKTSDSLLKLDNNKLRLQSEKAETFRAFAMKGVLLVKRTRLKKSMSVDFQARE